METFEQNQELRQEPAFASFTGTNKVELNSEAPFTTNKEEQQLQSTLSNDEQAD